MGNEYCLLALFPCAILSFIKYAICRAKLSFQSMAWMVSPSRAGLLVSLISASQAWDKLMARAQYVFSGKASEAASSECAPQGKCVWARAGC